ncbi:hypothetical protein COHA_008971 [Chlorella ohadii]|uniref:Uncharacterized protein n=1 Tax=Chlorella ohadii TaxID=2649997 RepID=A0AAD5DIW6_9CHLO|nr:hypothetical protein COHA_008971 [Chlorella ohadii]
MHAATLALQNPSALSSTLGDPRCITPLPQDWTPLLTLFLSGIVAVGGATWLLSHSIGSLEARQTATEARLTGVEARLDRLDQKLDQKFNQLDQKFNQLDQKLDQKFDQLLQLLVQRKQQ